MIIWWFELKNKDHNTVSLYIFCSWLFQSGKLENISLISLENIYLLKGQAKCNPEMTFLSIIWKEGDKKEMQGVKELY